MTELITDPWFFAAAIPAVIFVGLSKGGLGGAMGQMGVPLLALVVSPVQGAAIMLPILLVMDAAALWTWRRYHDVRTLRIMLPGAVAGIYIGYLTASMITPDSIILIVGLLTLWFITRNIVTSRRNFTEAIPHNPAKGAFWSVIAGFTSFVAHVGGPPYQIYALPLKQDPKIYTGTSTIFFAVVNTIKVVPYFALGQFDSNNLAASASLFPFAVAATVAGAWLVKRMSPTIFYPFMLAMLGLVSLKLIWDGSWALLG